MKQARSWLLLTASALLGSVALAQPSQPAADKAETAATVSKDATDAKDPAKKDEAGGDTDICQITPDLPQCKGGATPPVGGTTGGAGAAGTPGAPRKDVRADVYAVQQIYALRRGRVEISPYMALSLNDQFVSHPAPGFAANYYITNVLAVGINANVYAGLNGDSDFNFQNRRAARVAVPLNEYQWGANGNFTYVPVYGKFAAGFGNFIFHYDAYVVGGVGVLSTRPIPVIDPDNRKFSFSPKLNFNLGLGLRIFFNRWLAMNVEVRDYIFQEQLENMTVAASGVKGCTKCATDPTTWNGDKAITNNIQAQLGLSVFVPFSWKYKLDK
jgi:outer membrane beta-barrel protein